MEREWEDFESMKTAAFIVTLLMVAASAFAGNSLTLAWTPSVSTNVTNYRIYAWTNCSDASCQFSNAVQVAQVGSVTNATLTDLLPSRYTFAATSVITNGAGGESALSNLVHYEIPDGVLVTVQSSTNLITWTNTPVFFRLKVGP